MTLKFFKCNHCGKVIAVINGVAVPTICCGEPMTELVPGATDGAFEKHVPVFTVEGNIVNAKVGEAEHPMMPEHFIQWIAIETKNGYQFKELKPGEKPEASFALTPDDALVAVYEYCNLHGLWKKEA